MRCHERRSKLPQGTLSRQWLLLEDIERSAPQPAGAQAIRERALVQQRPARDVYDDRTRSQQIESTRVENATCFVGERRGESHNIGVGQLRIDRLETDHSLESFGRTEPDATPHTNA